MIVVLAMYYNASLAGFIICFSHKYTLVPKYRRNVVCTCFQAPDKDETQSIAGLLVFGAALNLRISTLTSR